MKVFVTGIAGFLGSHLADAFLARGDEVVGIDNLIGGYRDNVPEGAKFIEGDLGNLGQVVAAMEGCDLVYHTACTAYEGLSVFSPSLIAQNTFQISVNAMTAAIINKSKRFVHCSSMARYGTQEITPFAETMVPLPQDPYGIAKYGAELMLRNMAEIHGIELVVAVPHNIVGPRQKYDDPFRNVASIMINLMLQGRQPIIYGDGTQVRCFSDIEDDVDCLMEFALNDKAVGQTFNIGPDEHPITINELAETIARLMQFDLAPTYMPGRPQEVKHATCSANKIREYFGYQTKVSLEQSLQKMIDYISMRGTRTFEYHLPIEIVSDKTPRTWTDRLF